MTDLTELKADIAALPADLTTREVYREACSLMFHRYGVRPTANKLYAAVGRGSMSTPVEVLAKFWESLRETSQLKLEAADMPEDVIAAGGELLTSLWRQARAAVEASFAEREAALRAREAACEDQLRAARSEQEKLETALAHRTESLLSLQTRYQEKERELASVQERAAALEARVGTLDAAVQQERRAVAKAESEFAARLEALMLAGKEAEARADNAVRRALLDLDRERTHVGRLLKEVDALREAGTRAMEQAAQREMELRAEQDTARQRATAAEAALSVHASSRAALEEENSQLLEEVIAARLRLDALSAAPQEPLSTASTEKAKPQSRQRSGGTRGRGSRKP